MKSRKVRGSFKSRKVRGFKPRKGLIRGSSQGFKSRKVLGAQVLRVKSSLEVQVWVSSLEN